MKNPKEYDYKLRFKILEILDQWEGYAFNYRQLVSLTGSCREEIKREMDVLRVMEYAAYVKGLLDDDGNLAGSGFTKVVDSKMSYDDYKEHLDRTYNL